MKFYFPLILGVLVIFLLLLVGRIFPLGFLSPYLTPVALLYLPLLLDRASGRKELGFFFPDKRSWFLFFSSSLIFLGGMIVLTRYLFLWSWQGFPSSLSRLGLSVAEEVIFRSLPEEFFFRGWLQKRCEELWDREIFRFAGGGITLANLVVSSLFALLHWLSYGGPERLFVFFPSLWFGWLRSSGGGLMLPILAHALSNLFVHWGQRA
jgi:membrane protease YdiL (CAAX protease family)